MTGVPVPVVGSVVVPLKIPLRVNVSKACAAGANPADNPTETAATVKPRDNVFLA